MAKYGSFSLGGNLDCPEFLQKKFYNINYWSSGYYVEETRVQWLWVRIQPRIRMDIFSHWFV